jgi:hypothetical protein
MSNKVKTAENKMQQIEVRTLIRLYFCFRIRKLKIIEKGPESEVKSKTEAMSVNL